MHQVGVQHRRAVTLSRFDVMCSGQLHACRCIFRGLAAVLRTRLEGPVSAGQ